MLNKLSNRAKKLQLSKTEANKILVPQPCVNLFFFTLGHVFETDHFVAYVLAYADDIFTPELTWVSTILNFDLLFQFTVDLITGIRNNLRHKNMFLIAVR